MKEKKAKEEPIVSKTIRIDIRLLTCKLSQDEKVKLGQELAQVTSQIASEKDRQKAIKAELNAALTSLVSKQTVLASRVTRGEEERNVNVRVELHPSGQIVEVREDNSMIIAGPREALPGELQLPLADKLEEELKESEGPKPGAVPAGEPPKA